MPAAPEQTAAPRRCASTPPALLALLLSGAALIACVWIVIPAPSYNVWLLSVIASEWSVWFGALGLTGIACGVFACSRGGARWLCRAAIACGALVVMCALFPVVSGWRAANRHDVSLSLAQYFAGVWNGSEGRAEFTTRTFATVDGNPLRLDVYLPPEEVARNGAGVIVVHGGSWNAGERSDFPQWNAWLAQQGFVVFDVDYRLAPQPNWRTATGDVKCAVAWVKRHATEFRIRPESLALMGRSAGGHLALLAAYTAGDARLPSSCAETDGVSVAAVVSLYAPTDLLWAYDNPANERVIDGPLTLRRFLGGDPHATNEMRERFLLASPVAHVTPRTPPTLLIHGGHDQLVRDENTKFLDARLTNAGVPHETVFLAYAQHGFDYNFNGWGAQVIKPVLLEFLREQMLEQTTQ